MQMLTLTTTFLALSLASLSAQQPVSVLVKARGPLTAAAHDALSAYAVHVNYSWPQIRAMAMDVTPANLAALAVDPLVARVEPDGDLFVPSARVVDATPAGGANGSAAATTMLTAWNQDQADTLVSGLDGTGVTVVIIDTGLPQNWADTLPPGVHMDLAHAASFAPQGFGRGIENPAPRTGAGAFFGQLPHGLGVTSIITGFQRLPGAELMAGAAPGATILPVRIYGQFGFAKFSWVVAAFLYVADLKATGAIPGPAVVNFSSQGPFSQVFDDAIDTLLATGTLFVTIAGNFGNQGVTFPGSKPEAICAGGAGFVGEFSTPLWYLGDVPENDPLAHYVVFDSGRELPGVPTASQIDVLGPGDWVIADWAFGNGRTNAGFSEGRAPFRLGIAFVGGTSFAGPHVTGIVAQMLQRNPNLTQAQAESILRSTALPIPPNPTGLTTARSVVPPWGANGTGAGLVQGGAAVAATPPQ
jgi:subtilisin family serine protease